MAVGLQIVEEVQHQGRVQIGHLQCRGRRASVFLDVVEQQLERVTVAFDGSGAGSALVNQTPQKEVLNQLRELDLRGPHDTPAPRSANASKRAEMMFISSGTAEKYQ